MSKASDDTIDEWIRTRKQKISDHRPPIVAMRRKLVFKEIDPRSLVVALAKEVAPVVERDFARRVGPMLIAFRRGNIFVDGGQVIGGGVEEIGRAEVLGDR